MSWLPAFPAGDPPPARRCRVRQAVNFCAVCPVRDACYQGAAERRPS